MIPYVHISQKGKSLVLLSYSWWTKSRTTCDSVIRDNLLNYGPTELLVEDFVHQHYVKVRVRRSAYFLGESPQETGGLVAQAMFHSIVHQQFLTFPWASCVATRNSRLIPFSTTIFGGVSGIFKDAHVFVKSKYSLWHFGSSLIWLLPCKDSKSTRLVQRLSNTRCLAKFT